MKVTTFDIGRKAVGVCLTTMLVLSVAIPVVAQHHHEAAGAESHHLARSTQWEGSPHGKAYSEFNHHLAGALVVLIGLIELQGALVVRGRKSVRALGWTPFLLPLSMLAAGAYLLGWSDHEAWPIGPMTFAQTFFGGDIEILQHKTYAILLLGVGTIETLRRMGYINQPAWRIPLPAFAILGGLLLFMHQHGDHPGAGTIMMNHMVMGTLAIVAGVFNLATVPWSPWFPESWRFAPRLAWPTLILLIGLQLLLYTE